MNARDFDAWLHATSRAPLVMGILNITPDSFSDGGQFAGRVAAIAHAREMIASGADLIDVGGESTRPGAQRVTAPEQIDRIAPVIEAIRRDSDVAISVDTTLSPVAEAALEVGADILNDISAGREDPAMLALAGHRGKPIILMHMQGEPGTMQANPQYTDVTAEVMDHLEERAAAALVAGSLRERIILDPGIGFGKDLEHNLQLLRELPRLKALGFTLLVGVSRKRFIGAITGVEKPSDRVVGSIAAGEWAILNGADILRVHDVHQTKEMVSVISALTQRT